MRERQTRLPGQGRHPPSWCKPAILLSSRRRCTRLLCGRWRRRHDRVRQEPPESGACCQAQLPPWVYCPHFLLPMRPQAHRGAHPVHHLPADCQQARRQCCHLRILPARKQGHPQRVHCRHRIHQDLPNPPGQARHLFARPPVHRKEASAQVLPHHPWR